MPAGLVMWTKAYGGMRDDDNEMIETTGRDHPNGEIVIKDTETPKEKHHGSDPTSYKHAMACI